MTSAKQIAANCRNAQLSTGPKTSAGKTVAKMNALKHGLLATTPLLPEEDPQQYEAFRQATVEEQQPVGVMEVVLADRLVSIAWRLRRSAQVETGVFSYNYHGRIAERAKRKAESLEVIEEFYVREDWLEKRVTITDKEGHEYAKREQEWAENMRDRGTGKEAAAFLGDCGDGFARLHRYEVGLEKSFCRALHESMRLQTVRAGSDQREGTTTQILAVSMHRGGGKG